MPGKYRRLVEDLPATPILPNLVSTELDIYRVREEEDLDFLPLFLPRTVAEVRIRANGHDSQATIGRILQALANDVKVPNLKTLGIKTSYLTIPSLNTSIAQVLQAYGGIQTLELEFRSGQQILEALFSAGQLNNLRHLNARTTKPDTSITLASRVWILELETLQITGTPPFLASLLTSVEPRSMRGVKIVVEKMASTGSNGASANTPFRNSLSSIGGFIHLETLEMEVKSSLLLDDLRYILPCTDLETLRIVGPQLSSVDGGVDLVQRMAKALPRLKTLELRSTFDNRNGAQALRLSHLEVLAKECQTLERLCISIDARTSKSPTFQLERVEAGKKNVLRELEITCTLLGDVSEIRLMTIVKYMWPWLRLGMPGEYRGLVEGLPATPILPNLVSTELDIYWMPENDSLEFLPLVLPRTVSEVRIQGKGPDSEATIGRVLQALANDVKVPNLKTFGITTWHATTTNLNTSISQVLRSYEGIQALKLELESGHQILEVLFSAGQLNNLSHLDARIMKPDPAIALPSRVWLPHLETLQLNGAHPFIVSLLTSVEPRSIREVKMVVEKKASSGLNEAPISTPFWNCLSSIGRFVHLKTLEVEVKFSVLLRDLHHILPCTDLETLRFIGPQLSSVEGEEDLVQRMVKAWPRLKNLELRSTFDSRHGAQALRLPHLQVIAKESQTLKRLCISLDARGRKSPMFQLESIKVAKENVLRELEISCALLEDVSEMGLVMIVKQMWPWLNVVSSERIRISGNVVVITIEFN
ncbi:hypothetical protein FRC01_001781 [Tulasnella sp. 417]|nr:hypothetical protein FRC01_001781 [Tulasnella sp. 417]